MRVCIVTVAGQGIGGMQDHTRSLARGLVATGHEVEVITGRAHDRPAREDRDGVIWHHLDTPTRHPRLPRRHPEWFRRSYEFFVELQSARPFDVVHSESTSALELVRRGVHRHVPFAIKFHGNYLGAVRQAWARLERAATLEGKVKELKLIVWCTGMHTQRGEWRRFRPCEWMVPSRAEFDDARRESFLKASQGHVVPNGIDASLFRPGDRRLLRAELGVGGEPLFVCAGRLERQKGTHLALAAVAELLREGRPVRLAILGSGPEQEALEALTREYGLSDRVVFTGPQPHPVLAKWLAAADAFLFPSERNEAAPLIPLQAMACGAPLIGSMIGNVPEVVDRPGVNGLLVPPGDPAALGQAMTRVLDDERLARTLGEEGRRRVVTEYTVERMVERTVAVYEAARRRHRDTVARTARRPGARSRRRFSARDSVARISGPS